MLFVKNNVRGVFKRIATLITRVIYTTPYYDRGGSPTSVEVHDNLSEGVRITNVQVKRIQDKTSHIKPLKEANEQLKRRRVMHARERGSNG